MASVCESFPTVCLKKPSGEGGGDKIMAGISERLEAVSETQLGL